MNLKRSEVGFGIHRIRRVIYFIWAFIWIPFQPLVVLSTLNVGEELFSQAAQQDSGLEREAPQWEKKDIKIGLLSSHSGMIPICLSPGDPSPSLDQNGICLQAVPLSKGWVFPTVPLQSLPVSREAPQTKAWLFLLTNTATEREMQHIFMRLSGISCFIMKERIVSASQRWNMWHQEMVWCCCSGLRRGGGGTHFHATNMPRCRLESIWRVWMELPSSLDLIIQNVLWTLNKSTCGSVCCYSCCSPGYDVSSFADESSKET